MPMYFEKDLSLPVAEELGSRGINLPSYPGLDFEDVDFITKFLSNYFI
jgi:perosamine synthetase